MLPLALSQFLFLTHPPTSFLPEVLSGSGWAAPFLVSSRACLCPWIAGQVFGHTRRKACLRQFLPAAAGETEAQRGGELLGRWPGTEGKGLCDHRAQSGKGLIICVPFYRESFGGCAAVVNLGVQCSPFGLQPEYPPQQWLLPEVASVHL